MIYIIMLNPLTSVDTFMCLRRSAFFQYITSRLLLGTGTQYTESYYPYIVMCMHIIACTQVPLLYFQI